MSDVKRFSLIGSFLLALAAAVGCGGSDAPAKPAHDLVLANNATLGSFLATGAGKTLYYFSEDVPGTASTDPVSGCNDAECLAAWPVYHAPANAKLGDGVDAADLTEFTRADGAKQTAYKGWPLYTYAPDVKAGDVTGENTPQTWFVAHSPFYSVLVIDKAALHFLSGPQGQAYYTNKNDTVGTAATPAGSVCNAAPCTTNWPVVDLGTAPVAPSALSASDFGSFVRQDGRKQSTFRGHPLYTFIGDKKPIDTAGQGGAGGLFFVIDPSAK